jgi:hypothetical protein
MLEMTELPCLLVFRDIRSPDHSMITLKGLTLGELTAKMRAVVATIEQSVSKQKDPLTAIQRYQSREHLKTTGQQVAKMAGSFFEKRFEAAIRALIEAKMPVK